MPFSNFPAKLPAIHDAAQDLSLRPIPANKADWLGETFAEMDPWASYPYPASALSKYFYDNEPGAPRLAIFDGDDVVGALGLRLNWLRGPYIQFLGLIATHQSKRIGQRAIKWVEDEAREETCLNIWVLVSNENHKAKAFYERCGFSPVAPLEDLVRAGRTELLLRKRL